MSENNEYTGSKVKNHFTAFRMLLSLSRKKRNTGVRRFS